MYQGPELSTLCEESLALTRTLRDYTLIQSGESGSAVYYEVPAVTGRGKLPMGDGSPILLVGPRS